MYILYILQCVHTTIYSILSQVTPHMLWAFEIGSVVKRWLYFFIRWLTSSHPSLTRAASIDWLNFKPVYWDSPHSTVGYVLPFLPSCLPWPLKERRGAGGSVHMGEPVTRNQIPFFFLSHHVTLSLNSMAIRVGASDEPPYKADRVSLKTSRWELSDTISWNELDQTTAGIVVATVT